MPWFYRFKRRNQRQHDAPRQWLDLLALAFFLLRPSETNRQQG